MAKYDEVKKNSEKTEKKVAKIIKENPLIAINLGDLVMQMHKLYALDPNVIKPRKEIPDTSITSYNQYHNIVKELNRREENYHHNRFRGYI